MKPATAIVSCLIFIIVSALLAGAAFAQVPVGQPTPDPNAPEPFVDTTVTPTSDGSDGVPPDPTANIARWMGTFNFGGTVFPFTMVGGSPLQLRAQPSYIPVVIVPLRIDFGRVPDVTGPDGAACGDTQSVLSRVQNSPLFTSDLSWTQGNTVVGTATQYTDAFQRANFWKYIVSHAPNFHVLLNPVTTTSLWVVPAATVQAAEDVAACPDHPVVTVDKSVLDTIVVPGIIQHFGIRPNTLLLVLTYNVKILQSDGFLVGYHNALANGQTYIVGSYIDPGVGGQNLADISILSHELAEWMDDPFLNNFVPPWGHIGQVNGCEQLLEVGDPLTFTTSPVFSRGFNYHVQDLGFISWFARVNPAVSVNGWYSMFNNLGPGQPVCN
jgi:hypothetical protein